MQFFRYHTPQTPIDVKMSRALHPDMAFSQITPHKCKAPSSHATKVITRKLGAFQDETSTRTLDRPSSKSTTQSSKEASSNEPTAPTVTVFPFFRLPPELRDEIYIYASMTERVWIGRPPRFNDTPDDVIVEQDSICKPATLIRTEHSIISVCHEARDEFRTAVWREYMTEPRVVDFRIYDFAISPLEELFADCSAKQVEKLREPDKCRVHHHITPAFHKYRRSNSAYWEIVNVLDDWLRFETRAALDVEQSIDVCDWYDARLLRTTMEETNITHIADWETRWECPVFLNLWDVVSEAYEDRSAERIVARNAFHKLAPLGQ